jgi:uncharacterized protein (TIGR04222 family)
MDTPSIEGEPMTLNPFDWTAGPFLTAYTLLAVVVFMVCFRVKEMIGPPAQANRQLSVLELAYLAGDARRLADAVLLTLTSGHGAIIDSDGRKITVTDQTPLATLMGRMPPLAFSPDMTRQQFQTAVGPIVERVRARLQQLGYCPSDDQMMFFRMTVLPFVGFLLLFGIVKAIIGGAERHHPVGFLIFLLFATVVAGFVLVRRPTRTQAGNDALQAYQASHARASRAPLDHELLLAVALSGVVVLSGTSYAPIYAASKTMGSGGGDGGGSSGCGGGGGGCGGCSG